MTQNRAAAELKPVPEGEPATEGAKKTAQTTRDASTKAKPASADAKKISGKKASAKKTTSKKVLPGLLDDETPEELVRRVRKRAMQAENRLRAMEERMAADTMQATAAPATMKRRHWGVLASFFIMVLAPLAVAIFYLFAVAEDQYRSTAGFIVRSQESSGANELLGGLAQFAGASTASDSDILYEFVRSQEIVAEVDKQLDLKAHFAAQWPHDWAFALWPTATLEDLTWYWQRIVRVSYDAGSGLMELQVNAYDAQMAQEITRAIVDYSQVRINALNEQAREDAMRYARADLDEALERLKVAREALIQFRTRTRIVDPEADIQGRMGVMNNLQQQLAEALIEYDLMRGSLNIGDPRLTTGQKRIDVIRDRIGRERNSFASADADQNGGVEEDYPSLISEYERLSVDREFAEQTYRAALTALEVARDEATRQSRYLATYIRPTLAETSEYPRRYVLSALTGLFLLLGWAIIILIYYSIRDRR